MLIQWMYFVVLRFEKNLSKNFSMIGCTFILYYRTSMRRAAVSETSTILYFISDLVFDFKSVSVQS